MWFTCWIGWHCAVVGGRAGLVDVERASDSGLPTPILSFFSMLLRPRPRFLRLFSDSLATQPPRPPPARTSHGSWASMSPSRYMWWQMPWKPGTEEAPCRDRRCCPPPLRTPRPSRRLLVDKAYCASSVLPHSRCPPPFPFSSRPPLPAGRCEPSSTADAPATDRRSPRRPWGRTKENGARAQHRRGLRRPPTTPPPAARRMADAAADGPQLTYCDRHDGGFPASVG